MKSLPKAFLLLCLLILPTWPAAEEVIDQQPVIDVDAGIVIFVGEAWMDTRVCRGRAFNIRWAK
ncbi:hypothetical protein KUV89_04295 [Marinobacter hydrocarbonoclasticus]|nr:hypothetical protein [Marinobacter nauticus]